MRRPSVPPLHALSLVVALTLATLPASAQQHESAGCRVDGLNAARPLTTRDGRPLYVETPSALRLATGTALIGTPTLLWHAPDRFFAADSARTLQELGPYLHSLGAIVRADGDIVPIPTPVPDGGRPRSPAALPRDARSAHVAWATATDTTALIYSDALWYAPFVDERWLPTERVLTGPLVSWIPPAATLALIGGEPAIAVPSIDTTDHASHGGVELLRRRDGRWTRTRIRTFQFADAAAVADDGASRPLLLFASGTIDSAGRPHTMVAAATITDSAPPRPHVIEWLDGWSAREIQFVRSADRLYVLWTAQDSADAMRHRLDVHVTSDRGDTWTRLPSLELPPNTLGVRATAAPEGGIVVAARARTLVLALLWRERWSLADTDTLPAPWSMPTIAPTSADTLLLTWGTGRDSPVPGQRDAPLPILYHAKLRIRCTSPRE